MPYRTLPDLSDRPFELQVEREIAAPPAALYRAWTRQLDLWFARPGSVQMEPRVEAPFFFETVHRVRDDRPALRQPHYGRFLRLEIDRLIELTWVTGPLGTRGVETVVKVELTPTRAGTRLRLTHAGFPDQESRDRHAEAWPLVLAQLDERLTKGPDDSP